MTGPEPADLWIVGPGRVGLALGLLFVRTGAARGLHFSGRRPAPPVHPLFAGDPPAATYSASLSLPLPPPRAVLLSVPDDSIAAVARSLARAGLPAGTVALHTSGALGRDALAPLADAGCSIGSLHPLAAVSDAVHGAERLRGGWFALEGDAEAVEAARGWVAAAGGRVLQVDGDAKPLYHAAAVFASNYLVALLDVAERIMEAAGVDGPDARAALAELALGAVRAAGEMGPAHALTGPVARGDAATVERHLLRLSPPDRALYSVLARETLALARRRGLDPAAAERVQRLLGE